MVTRTSTTLLDGLNDPRNDRAWRRFYTRYTPMLLSYAKRVGLSDADAQDAVAETLTTFLQKYAAGEYDRDRGRLKSWLGGIAFNKIRKVRERRSHLSLDASASNDGGGPVECSTRDDLDAVFEHEWRLERLSQALEILRGESDPTTYQAFDLYAIKNWPAGKVASFLDLSKNAVYIAKTRTIRRLRQVVTELIDEEVRQ